jgi:hypothetical protein
MAERIMPISQRASSFGASVGQTIDLAQRVAADELRLLQMESQERIESLARRGAWIAFGALCLLIAWVGLLAAAVVALEGRFPLELRLLGMALSQLLLGAALVAYGVRDRSRP